MIINPFCISGLNLWSTETLEEHTNIIHHAQQKLEWTSGQSMNEKFDYMELDLWGAVREAVKVEGVRSGLLGPTNLKEVF